MATVQILRDCIDPVSGINLKSGELIVTDTGAKQMLAIRLIRNGNAKPVLNSQVDKQIKIVKGWFTK